MRPLLALCLGALVVSLPGCYIVQGDAVVVKWVGSWAGVNGAESRPAAQTVDPTAEKSIRELIEEGLR